ncbi:hypothetical protein FHS43_005263 [Streptosporangium becharense]|uniref:Serine hydrolase n=1 Tax=Streptosporangium becharense TaxID=1816182 RepID=A0A7W9IIK1_9ACTN|nr:serine hydrolase [Streptosporangium becharense]MBB2913954.1 hypothetical protein [Streptosporangium becharense]MBB5821385.1 hypothetical protein [Streptosporangium becharense]
MRLPFRSKRLLALALAAAAVPAMALPAAALTAPATASAGASTGVSTGVSATGAEVSAAPEIPDSPAGRQLRWFLEALSRAPIAESELREHFNAAYLASVTPQGFNDFLKQAAGFRLATFTKVTPTALAGTGKLAGETFTFRIGVDKKGKIELLLVAPPEPKIPAAPKSWKELDARLRRVAPNVGFLAAEIDADGRCRVAHAVAPDKVQPLGSIFKVYVLGAVAEKIRAGELSWDTELTIKPEWRSAGEGGLNNQPDDSTTTVREAARLMISISDNTATDLLIHTVGREAVETTMRRWSKHANLNIPFLTTKELFLLKGVNHPQQARTYAGLDVAGKRVYLEETVAKQELKDIKPWDRPREIGTVEWFGSPRDVCRAYAGLAELNGKQVADAMSVNDLGLGLNRRKWPTVWAKGGSELGVLDMSFFARSAKGKTYLVTVLTNDPAKPLDESKVAPELISLSRGGFKLAAGK